MGDPGPPVTARTILRKMPPGFLSDGCSHAPDEILGRDLGWCCRIHDWRYCTRAHPAGALTWAAQKFADKELGWNVRGVLPFFLRWIGWAYYRATHRFGGMGSFNSCGAGVGERCRHGLPRPEWMARSPSTPAPSSSAADGSGM